MSTDIPSILYPKSIEEKIEKIIQTNSEFYKKKKEDNTFFWTNIMMMQSRLASDFGGSFMSPIFKKNLIPPSNFEPDVRNEDNILILTSHPYYNILDEKGEKRYDKDRRCILFSDDQEKKIMELFPSKEYYDKIWFWSYFPLPINTTNNKPDMEFYFFSYYFYLILLFKRPSHILVTNKEVFHRMSKTETWFRECKISILSEKLKGRECLTLSLDVSEDTTKTHVIKVMHIDHPLVLLKNVTSFSYNKVIVKVLMEGEQRNDKNDVNNNNNKNTPSGKVEKVYKNLFEKMKDSQLEKERENKNKSLLEKKPGTELWKKKKVKEEAKAKREESKRKKDDKMREQHADFFQGAIIIKKGKMEKG